MSKLNGDYMKESENDNNVYTIKLWKAHDTSDAYHLINNLDRENADDITDLFIRQEVIYFKDTDGNKFFYNPKHFSLMKVTKEIICVDQKKP